MNLLPKSLIVAVAIALSALTFIALPATANAAPASSTAVPQAPGCLYAGRVDSDTLKLT
ncbi:MAG: hypothetical protein FWF71_02000 [Actinomycetia bacterium]|nr:hypothetical protein [Actinomycetes bacterium]